MVILEESVSRYHAEITYSKNKFFLQDLGSTTGTFIKINSQFPLEKGQILEMGSNQFRINEIEMRGNSLELDIKVIDGPYESLEYLIRLNENQSKATIGRKLENQISFPNDLHLSNLHGQIVVINNQPYFEEMSSTNGTWLRLSSEGITSQLVQLEENSVFKIGTSSTYKVELKCLQQQKNQFQKSKSLNEINYGDLQRNKYKELAKKFKKKKECMFCQKQEKDALLFPCRHNLTCMKCAETLTVCPICEIKITDKLKIYQS